MGTPMTTRPAVGAGMAMVVLVAACARAPLEPLPTRPPVPAGWTIQESDEGDLRLALPAGIEPVSTAGSVIAQEPLTREGVIELEVWGSGPASLDQPAAGETLLSWLADHPLVPRNDGVTVVGSTSTTDISAPSGRGVELKVTAFPGTPEESLVLVYAIRTIAGVAILRFVGRPERLRQRADDLRLVVLLAEFGGRRLPSP